MMLPLFASVYANYPKRVTKFNVPPRASTTPVAEDSEGRTSQTNTPCTGQASSMLPHASLCAGVRGQSFVGFLYGCAPLFCGPVPQVSVGGDPLPEVTGACKGYKRRRMSSHSRPPYLYPSAGLGDT